LSARRPGKDLRAWRPRGMAMEARLALPGPETIRAGSVPRRGGDGRNHLQQFGPVAAGPRGRPAIRGKGPSLGDLTADLLQPGLSAFHRGPGAPIGDVLPAGGRATESSPAPPPRQDVVGWDRAPQRQRRGRPPSARQPQSARARCGLAAGPDSPTGRALTGGSRGKLTPAAACNPARVRQVENQTWAGRALEQAQMASRPPYQPAGAAPHRRHDRWPPSSRGVEGAFLGPPGRNREAADDHTGRSRKPSGEGGGPQAPDGDGGALEPAWLQDGPQVGEKHRGSSKRGNASAVSQGGMATAMGARCWANQAAGRDLGLMCRQTDAGRSPEPSAMGPLQRTPAPQGQSLAGPDDPRGESPLQGCRSP